VGAVLTQPIDRGRGQAALDVAEQRDAPVLSATVSRSSLAKIVLEAPKGTVLALGGLQGDLLRRLVDEVEAPPDSPRVLFTPIAPARTTEAIVQQVIELLADTVHRLAPDRPPRVGGLLPAIELTQLALAIGSHGIVLVVDADDAGAELNPAAFVHALEWIAQRAHCAVVALFPVLPPHRPPFDRILYGARISLLEDREIAAEARPVASRTDVVWIAPWLGSPHPLSETEQRLEKALRADAELAALFDCNQLVDTVRGSRPRVDFVWTKGRLAIELDGYGSHGNRAAFMYDRHRDYELTLSGYTVLRLANDEIAQDVGKAVEKIRDIVRLCRDRIN
jgi:very-short-patch-repair endonuclease